MASLFELPKGRNDPSAPSVDDSIKQKVVCPYTEYDLVIKRNGSTDTLQQGRTLKTSC